MIVPAALLGAGMGEIKMHQQYRWPTLEEGVKWCDLRFSHGVTVILVGEGIEARAARGKDFGAEVR